MLVLVGGGSAAEHPGALCRVPAAHAVRGEGLGVESDEAGPSTLEQPGSAGDGTGREDDAWHYGSTL